MEIKMRLKELLSEAEAPKVILTDVDGVLLNRDENKFHQYMLDQGFSVVPGQENNNKYGTRYGIETALVKSHVKKFNDQHTELVPVDGAVENVKKLASQGYRFHAITSMSDDPNACMNRVKNLQKYFGNVFNKTNVQCLPMGHASKGPALSKYANTGYYWVEDGIENAIEGVQHGLVSFIIDSPWSKSVGGQPVDDGEVGVIRVGGWADIVNYLSQQETQPEEPVDNDPEMRNNVIVPQEEPVQNAEDEEDENDTEIRPIARYPTSTKEQAKRW